MFRSSINRASSYFSFWYIFKASLKKFSSLNAAFIEKNKKNIDTTSIDASTRQIADTSTETKQEVENIKQINPDSVLPSNPETDVFLQDTKNALSKLTTQELTDLRYSTSQSVAQDAFAKVFGIPASRIFNKKDLRLNCYCVRR